MESTVVMEAPTSAAMRISLWRCAGNRSNTSPKTMGVKTMMLRIGNAISLSQLPPGGPALPPDGPPFYPNKRSTVRLITSRIQLGQTPMVSIKTIRGAIATTSRRLISILWPSHFSLSGPCNTFLMPLRM